jgi:hypothetical protein
VPLPENPAPDANPATDSGSESAPRQGNPRHPSLLTPRKFVTIQLRNLPNSPEDAAPLDRPARTPKIPNAPPVRHAG